MTRLIFSSLAVAAMLSIAMPSAGVGKSMNFNYGKLTMPTGKSSGSSSTAAKKKSTVSPSTFSADEKKSKAISGYLNIDDIPGESLRSGRGKWATPPPKGDCMSCAD